MSGIILLLILSVWFYTVKKISGLCTSTMLPGTKKIIIYRLLFVLFFIAPVADDIIGGFQFRSLCKHGYPAVYNLNKAKNKTVYLRQVPVQIQDLKLYMAIPSKKIEYTIIPISEESWEFIDVTSSDILISWKDYHAKGGWLSRLIGFPEGSPPYTFNAICSSEGNFSLLKRLNMKTVNGEKNYE